MNSSDKQEKLYSMLERLKIMAREIPPKYQLRLPYDVLSSLAHLLLDNTVFEIVKELIELQHMAEKHMYQQRLNIVTRHKCERENLLKTQKQEMQNAQCQGRTHVLQRLPALHKDQLQKMETKHSQELLNFDRRVLEVLDEKVCEPLYFPDPDNFNLNLNDIQYYLIIFMEWHLSLLPSSRFHHSEIYANFIKYSFIGSLLFLMQSYIFLD